MNDLGTLQGRWIQTSCNDNGVVNPYKEHENPELIISDKNFAVFEPDGRLLLAGTFTLNTENTLKEIDWTDTEGPDKGKTFLSIYTLSSNHFAFNAADEDISRPDSFAPGLGFTIRNFVR